MNKKIIIEKAKIGDLPKIEYLLHELINTIDDSEKFDTKFAIDNYLNMIDDPNSHIFLARLGEDIVGFINFTTRKTILHKAPSAIIDEIVVAKAHRRKGIGNKLLKSTMKRCRELECCEIEVSTEKKNRRAKDFYEKCGFNENAVLLEYDLD